MHLEELREVNRASGDQTLSRLVSTTRFTCHGTKPPLQVSSGNFDAGNSFTCESQAFRGGKRGGIGCTSPLSTSHKSSKFVISTTLHYTELYICVKSNPRSAPALHFN